MDCSATWCLTWIGFNSRKESNMRVKVELETMNDVTQFVAIATQVAGLSPRNGQQRGQQTVESLIKTPCVSWLSDLQTWEMYTPGVSQSPEAGAAAGPRVWGNQPASCWMSRNWLSFQQGHSFQWSPEAAKGVSPLILPSHHPEDLLCTGDSEGQGNRDNLAPTSVRILED